MLAKSYGELIGYIHDSLRGLLLYISSLVLSAAVLMSERE